MTVCVDQNTPVLLALFTAAPHKGGIEIQWRFGDPSMADDELERSDGPSGPWSRIEAEARDGEGLARAFDRSVIAGRTYFYRLLARSSGGSALVFGPISVTAGETFTEFALARPAPNPAIGLVRMEYTVAREGPARLTIIDLQGREVTTLARGFHAPGRYQAIWTGEARGARAKPGLYFVRLDAPGVRLVQRITLVD